MPNVFEILEKLKYFAILGTFSPNEEEFSRKNWLSFLHIYGPLTTRKKIKKICVNCWKSVL